MRLTADHLHRSRHGIWYVRWVVPSEFRQRHPALPHELKRSTRTADKRTARGMARRLLGALLLHFAHGTGKTMASFHDNVEISGWTVERDRLTGNVTKVVVDPLDTPAGLAMLERYLAVLAAAEPTSRAIPADVVSHDTAVSQPTALLPAPHPDCQSKPAGNSILLSEAIEKYGKFQIASKTWSDNTFVHTHAPSLRVFRELASPEATASSNDGLRPALDMPVSMITATVIEKFVEEFWSFPAQQGKRSDSKTARDVFKAGGQPQSRANVFKRLAHIRQFLAYCVTKSYVQSEAVQELELVLAKDTARAREKAAVEAVGDGGYASDGYVAFSQADLHALFGDQYKDHAQDNPARLWIPLISLYTALRVSEVSQLRPRDFEVVDGIQCVRVRGETVGDAKKPKSQRVKTAASVRAVPLHPKLIEWGLMELVHARHKAGCEWVWDGLLWTPKSGFGKYPSRDFHILAKRVGVYEKKRKVFHSLRSTLAQALEREGLEAQLIDRFLGHEVKTTRSVSYSRTDEGRYFPVARVHEVLSRVDFGIDPSQTPS